MHYLTTSGKKEKNLVPIFVNRGVNPCRFHVDGLSSAHVYLRMRVPNTSYDELPPKALEECAQLTKENSIEGCKKKGVTIVYTWASNLLKTDDMEVGAVSFKNESLVIKLHIEKKTDVLKKI
jgi:hypothetical protein